MKSSALLMSSHGTTRILLVEDNDASRMLISDFLGYCGYQVMSLRGGSEFMTMINQFRPHLVLLDLKLPDVDGFVLLKQLQHSVEWAKLPVIVVSAYAFQSDQQRALSLGARRYLVKPVRLAQMQEAIREELGSLIG